MVGVRPDPEWPDRYRIEISEANDYPEVLSWQTDGLIQPDVHPARRAKPVALGARARRSHCLPNDSVTLSDPVPHSPRGMGSSDSCPTRRVSLGEHTAT